MGNFQFTQLGKIGFPLTSRQHEDRCGPVRTARRVNVNVRFAAMVSHYLFEAEFCNPAGLGEGQIEKNVQDARHRVWQPVPSFASLDALNAWLQSRCGALWREIEHPEQPGRTGPTYGSRNILSDAGAAGRSTAFIEHTSGCRPLPRPLWTATAYSVPASFANRPVSVAPLCRPRRRCHRRSGDRRTPARDSAQPRTGLHHL